MISYMRQRVVGASGKDAPALHLPLSAIAKDTVDHDGDDAAIRVDANSDEMR